MTSPNPPNKILDVRAQREDSCSHQARETMLTRRALLTGSSRLRTSVLVRRKSSSAFAAAVCHQQPAMTFSARFSSTKANDDDKQPKPTTKKAFSSLDMAVVRQIKAELMAVDANSDGR